MFLGLILSLLLFSAENNQNDLTDEDNTSISSETNLDKLRITKSILCCDDKIEVKNTFFFLRESLY